MSLIFWNRKSIDNICGGNMYGVEADNGTITSSTTKQKSMDTWWTCSDPRTLLSFLSLHFKNEDIFKKKKTTIVRSFLLFVHFALSTKIINGPIIVGSQCFLVTYTDTHQFLHSEFAPHEWHCDDVRRNPFNFWWMMEHNMW